MKVNKISVVELRNLQNWSQEDLAAATGLSVRTIQRVEKNGVASLESSKAIAAAFDVTTDEIRKPEWGWHHVMMFSKPFWKMLFIGVLISVFGIFITVKGIISEASAAYWAGLLIGTLSSVYLFECYKLYQKEFGP